MDLSRRMESALALLEKLQEQVRSRRAGAGPEGELLADLGRELEELRADCREADIRLGLLDLMVRARDPEESLVSALQYLMERFDIEASGLRLREGEDYPYFATRGFSKEFVVAESSLCERDSEACPVRDSLGKPVLECMCGAVLQGRIDPSQPFFTAGGSFWTNSTSELLATTTEAERVVKSRDRCNGEGYESVALLPLRAADETFGLVQLNDSRQGRFTPQTIALLEDLAERLAEVLV